MILVNIDGKITLKSLIWEIHSEGCYLLLPQGMLTTILFSIVLSSAITFYVSYTYFLNSRLSLIGKKQAMLEQRGERFRMLVEHSGDMLTIHDREGFYQYVSPASTRLLGYETGELLGKLAYDYIHADDLREMKWNLTKLLKTEYVQMTFRIRAKNGVYVWFESTFTGVMNKEGKLEEVIVVSRNITERKLLELELKESNERLEYLSTIDSVTGLSNRRYFEEYLENKWREAIATSTPFAVLFVDIDCFKNYNDTYGHQEGDDALQKVAEILTKTVQGTEDLVARYGGEEFIVVLPNTDSITALEKAEEIRSRVEALQIEHTNSSISTYITVSIGVSCISEPNTMVSTDLLIAKADKALYEAKQAGRNQVKLMS